MNLQEVLQQLDEAQVTKLITSFKSLDLESGWSEKHAPMKPFSSNWGRGALAEDGKALANRSGGSHAQLWQSLSGGKNLTFYWGYVVKEQTLYLQLATLRGTGFSMKNLLEITTSVMVNLRNIKWAVPRKNIIMEGCQRGNGAVC